MTDIFSKEKLFNFTYSKISHFDFFRDINSDIELYGKKIILKEDADLITYQNLLVYSFLKNKEKLNILQIGENNLKSFEKLQEQHNCWKIGIDNLTKEEIEFKFINISENTDSEKIDPKSYFDFIFLSSSINNIPEDLISIENFVSKIKYLLKIKGIFIGCFVNIIFKGNIWVNDMITFIESEKSVNKNDINSSKIIKDPDLFVLSEEYYKNHWEKYTNKTYEEFGKPFSYNVFIENVENITKEDFSDFAYSKKSHYDFYKDSNYIEELGLANSEKELTINDYQNLLVYSTIKSNFKIDSKILLIGKVPQYIINKLKIEYDLYILENPDLLLKNTDFGNLIFKEIFFHSNKKVAENIKDFFDFIYYLPDNKNKDYSFYYDALTYSNLRYLLKNQGLCLVSSKPSIYDESIYYPHFFNFLFLNNVFKYNKFVKANVILSDKDLFVSEDNEILYNLLWQKIEYLPLVCISKPNHNLSVRPVYVFHHLVKCGGTSMIPILNKWFRTINDKIDDEDVNTYILKKYDINNFYNDTCLISHFQREGIYLHQRYPEFLKSPDEYKIFIFLRDPLYLKISLYYYTKKYSVIDEKATLAGSLMTGKNFIASMIPCNESNYKEILDRYFFIGFLEKFQESLDLFADITGKKREIVPVLNTTEKDSQLKELSPEFLDQFRKNNSLDYKIYNYCLEKFNKLSDNFNKP